MSQFKTKKNFLGGVSVVSDLDPSFLLVAQMARVCVYVKHAL